MPYSSPNFETKSLFCLSNSVLHQVTYNFLLPSEKRGFLKKNIGNSSMASGIWLWTDPVLCVLCLFSVNWTCGPAGRVPSHRIVLGLCIEPIISVTNYLSLGELHWFSICLLIAFIWHLINVYNRFHLFLLYMCSYF